MDFIPILGARRTRLSDQRCAKICTWYTDELLYDNNQRTRETAIRILREVGDKQSIAHLKKLIFTENLSSFHESAQKTIKDIRSRKDSVTSKTPNEEEARLKALEERLQKLEKDYKELLEKY